MIDGRVELTTDHIAYRWDCDECGTRNYVKLQAVLFQDDVAREACYRDVNQVEEWEELPADWRNFVFLETINEVTCRKCSTSFEVHLDQSEDEDDFEEGDDE